MWFNVRFGLPTNLSKIHLTSKDGSNAKDWYDLAEAAGYIAVVDSEDPQPVGAFAFSGKYTNTERLTKIIQKTIDKVDDAH